MSAAEPAFNRPALEQLLGKRFFYAPAFSLYGGNFLFFFLVAWFKEKALTLAFAGYNNTYTLPWEEIQHKGDSCNNTSSHRRALKDKKRLTYS